MTALHSVTPSQLAFALAHKARLARMSGIRAKLQPCEVVGAAPIRQRREYETAKHPSIFMPTTQRVLLAVASEFNITVADIIGPQRIAKYCVPRFVAIGILVEITNMSLPAIGRRLGGRDHTTILHARNRARVLFSSEAFRNRIEQIKAELLL